MILIIADTYLHNVDEKDLPKWEKLIFPCGHCSAHLPAINIYHNIFGAHLHMSKEELKLMIKEAGLNVNNQKTLICAQLSS